MLLSDRDITAAIAEGRLGIEPYDKALVQPSSIDVRLDRYFRVFNNARYTHIDPAEHPYGSAVYGSRYQDQRGPTPSRSFRNFTRAETRRPAP